MTRSETANLWAERLQRFEQAEMTIAEFCVSEGVSQPSFYNWRRKLRSLVLNDAGTTAKFVPVALQRMPERTESAETHANTTIELPGGIRIRVEVPVDRQPSPQAEAGP